jgi:spermidine synthase
VSRRGAAGGPAAGIALFAFGFFPLFAQALLFRDFLSQFEGHEFGVGSFFASWLLWLGAGAWAARALRGDLAALAGAFPLLLLAYLPAFLLQHQALLSARDLAGVQAYEVFPLHKLVWAAALANAPVSFVTGLLFPLACVWMSRARLPLAAVYALEALGGFAGGLAATALLASGWRAEAMFAAAAAGTAAAAALCGATRRQRALAAAVLALAAGAWAAGLPGRWGERADRRAWERLLPGGALAGRFVTPQAVYLHGHHRGQFNVLANETICESVPETEHAAEVAALHLAQKPGARRVLVIGASYPLCLRFLAAAGIEQVAWSHPDPAYPAKLLAALPTGLRTGDARLTIVGEEARDFLRREGRPFDLILVNLPDATSLVLNRYFTDEFFALLKGGLARDGVLGVRVSGGENYLGGGLVNLGASVYAGLRAAFAKLAIKPGDETWLFASDEAPVTSDAAELLRRYRGVPGHGDLYPADGIPQRFPPDRVAFQLRKYADAVAATDPFLLLNSDEFPRSMLHSLLLAAQQAGAGPGLGRTVRAFALRGLWIIVAGVLLLVALRLRYVSGRGGQGDPGVAGGYETALLILSTGFAGMVSSVVLMFHFQVRFGALSLYAGLLSALFMLGLWAGSEAGRRRVTADVRRSRRGLSWMLLAHVAFLAAVARAPQDLGTAVFYLLFFLAGAFTGLYVPVAAAWLKSGPAAGGRESGSAFLLLDNAGGAAGGLAAALLLVPALGADLALFAAASLLAANLQARWGRAPAPAPARDPFDRAARAAAYVLTGAAAFWLGSSLLLRNAPLEEREDPLVAAARALAPEAEWTEGRTAGAAPHLAGRVGDTNALFAFRTERLAQGVRGYGGGIDLAVVVRPDGSLGGVRVVKSRETPAYLDRVKPWLDTLRGLGVAEGSLMGRVDGVSGATVTSDAVLRALDLAGPAFARAVLAGTGGAGEAPAPTMPVDRGAVIVLLLALAAWIARARPAARLRRSLLLASVAVAGFHLNAQYSLDQVLSLAALELPDAGLTLPFVMVVGVPVLVLLLGNLYCGWLCPFGALQELLGDLVPRRFRADPPKEAWRYARALKFAVLFALAVWFGASMRRELGSGDPLVTVFTPERILQPSALAAGALALSLVFRRFWCRALCPAGAFLSLLGRARLLRRAVPAVRPNRCGFGVRGARDLDCLQCDRCRQAGAAVAAGTSDPAARAWPYFAAVAVALALLASDLHKASERAAGAPSAQEAKPQGARPADQRAIRALIEQGRLSGREAMYYRPYEPE